MWPFSQWTTAGRAALTYITVGVLTVIWAGVWYGYLLNNPPTGSAYYWCTGFLVTGLTMVVIGLGVGMISRSGRPADLPPARVPVAVVNLEPNAMAAAPVLAPVNVPSPAVVPNGQVVLAPSQESFAG